jgi:peptidoglycan/LPS O-acetylase OafA/YrhL
MPHGSTHLTYAQSGYRPDIDGLRAIAVLSVLLYHLRFSSFSGGFVGVDIFFVISGYLIGSLIVRDAEQGAFRLLGFYARRARRILPALIAMTCTVLLLGYFWLLPSEFATAARSAAYALLSVSNIYFLNHLSYFEPLALTQPLLHTWSLGIEEQFYLAFPLLVLLLLKLGRPALVAGLVAAAAVSFGWSCMQVSWHKQAAFFLADSRGWELLIGTLVSVLPFTRRLSLIARNVMSLAGVGMIGWSIHAYNLDTSFPGAGALAPCIGTALVIAAGQSGASLAGEILSLRPINFVGRISYSLYLWHWPIIFFQITHPFLPFSHMLGDRPSVTIYSFAIASLSWLCVEQPFRRSIRSVPASKILVASAASLAILVAFCCVIILGRGFPRRFKPLTLQYAAYLDDDQAHFRKGKCFITTPYTFADFDQSLCLQAEAGRKNDLLIGDSHAAQLWYGLSTLLTGTHVMQVTSSVCPPVAEPPELHGPACAALMKLVFHTYMPTHNIDRLLIAARWTDEEIPGLKQTLATANALHIPVTLFGPMIEYDQKLPRLLAWATETNATATIAMHQYRNTALDGELRTIASQYGAQYVSIYSLLCDPAACPTLDPEGHALQFDTDHLTREGSLFLAHRALAAGLLE